MDNITVPSTLSGGWLPPKFLLLLTLLRQALLDLLLAPAVAKIAAR
jgi:hypothetical protein